MSRKRTLPPGIRQTNTGFQAYRWKKDPARPKGGYQTSKRFPSKTPIPEMVAWRQEQNLRGKRPELFVDPNQPVATFATEARAYVQLDKVQRMPTVDQRTQHIEEWVRVFGHRHRAGIQPQEIQRALDALRSRMSAASVNKRRTALMDLWTVLDGRHQANPVKGTVPLAETAPVPRAPALADVLTLLKGMRSDTDFARKCRARAAVIAWTGWPHAIVKALSVSDLHEWKRGRAFVSARKKGKGAPARWLPLLPEAKRALIAFHKADAYGHFSNSTLHKRITAACKALDIRPLRPYDLRHFFLTMVAVVTRDERAVMELGLISTPKIAARYTSAATDPRVQAAVRELTQKLPGLKRAAGRVRQNSVGLDRLQAVRGGARTTRKTSKSAKT